MKKRHEKPFTSCIQCVMNYIFALDHRKSPKKAACHDRNDGISVDFYLQHETNHPQPIYNFVNRQAEHINKKKPVGEAMTGIRH